MYFFTFIDEKSKRKHCHDIYHAVIRVCSDGSSLGSDSDYDDLDEPLVNHQPRVLHLSGDSADGDRFSEGANSSRLVGNLLPSRHKTLAVCCFNVGPASQTLKRHRLNALRRMGFQLSYPTV